MIKKNLVPRKYFYKQGYSDNLRRIADLLRRKRWTQKELAQELGTSESNTATYLTKLSKFEDVVSERVRIGDVRRAEYYIPKKLGRKKKKVCPCCKQVIE